MCIRDRSIRQVDEKLKIQSSTLTVELSSLLAVNYARSDTYVSIYIKNRAEEYMRKSLKVTGNFPFPADQVEASTDCYAVNRNLRAYRGVSSKTTQVHSYEFTEFRNICATIHTNLRSKTIHSTRIKFCKTFAIPTLIYASEAWVMTDVYKRQVLISALSPSYLCASLKVLPLRKPLYSIHFTL